MQPRVLDRDHGLIGEGADEFDLPVGEWLDPAPPQTDDPDGYAVAQQRHAQQRVYAADPRVVLRFVERIGPGIGNMHRPTFAGPRGRPACRCLDGWPPSRSMRSYSGSRAISGDPAECVILTTKDACLIGVAEPDGGLDHRLEHRFKLETSTR